MNPAGRAGSMLARSAVVSFVTGTSCIIAGGLLAAVTPPLSLSHGSWAAAYLVLVCGVSQCAFAAAHWYLGAGYRPGWAWTSVGCWNGGNACVLAGTLLDLPGMVDAGGILLVIALAAQLRQVAGGRRGWPLHLFRLLIIVLLVSIPIGVVLAHRPH